MGKKHIKNDVERIVTPPVETDEVEKGERDALSTVPPDVFEPEGQRQRWMKYGANVALTTVAVLVLAGIVVWAFQGTQKATRGLRARADLTSDASNVLKPQTKQLIQDLPKESEVTLVSLYPKLKKEEAANKGADTYQRVQDVLDEYRRNGKNIKVESIDPVADPGKLDAWVGEVKRKYGKNIENYEKFVKEFPKALDEIKKLAQAEAEQITQMVRGLEPTLDKLTEQQVELINVNLGPAQSTVLGMPRSLQQLNEGASEMLAEKIPDYAAAVQLIRNGTILQPGLASLSRQCDRLATTFTKLKDDQTAPEPVRQYAAAAVPRFQAIKAKADETLKKSENLGELKLDDVRKKIMPAQEGEAASPAVAVMGEADVRVVEDRSLWKSGEATGMVGRANDRPRLRFAGEQQLTSAILGLSQTKKTKVAFIRAGGGPLTTAGGGMMGMGGGPGPFGEIADRLRSYNFDVVEKDLSPPNPMRQQMPTPNEPTDEDLKDAVWVVFASQQQADPRMGMQMPGMLGERLKQHLDGGGSALCLVSLQGEDLAPALKDWGIEARPNVVLLHDRVESGTSAETMELVERARREPPIFILNEFGDHPITAPLRSLDAAMVYVAQVRKAAAVPAEVKVTEIIPMPGAPRSWGETDLTFLDPPPRGRPPAEPTFDAAADAAAPVFGGAVAERQGKGRLVVIGSASFASTNLVNYPDQKLYEKTKTVVSRFPGNGELFTNSIFWLAKNEKMMALSPSAMDAARIEPIPAGKLGFLKVGVVLVALPLMAVAAGIAVWMNRRG